MTLHVNNTGTLSTKTTSLLDEALSHQAVNHEYLEYIETTGFAYPSVVNDFAIQYKVVGDVFRYGLNALVKSLSHESHREILMENLEEEEGILCDDDIASLIELGIDPKWVVGVSHAELLARFKECLDINAKEQSLSVEAYNWKVKFMAWIDEATEYQLLGAFGIGTEYIVKYVYKYIVHGLRDHTDLTLEDYIFFELHREIDDKHGLLMLQITDELIAKDENAYDEIRKGMLYALEHRLEFWVDMLERTKTCVEYDQQNGNGAPTLDKSFLNENPGNASVEQTCEDA